MSRLSHKYHQAETTFHEGDIVIYLTEEGESETARPARLPTRAGVGQPLSRLSACATGPHCAAQRRKPFPLSSR
jgi:hypothetical protein